MRRRLDFLYVGGLKTLRPGMRWALGLSVLAALVALALPSPDVVPGGPGANGDGSGSGVGSSASGATSGPAVPYQTKTHQALPEQLARLDLEPAVGDPFADGTQAALEAIRPVPPTAPTPILAPVLPSPPSLNYRFLGLLMDPQGLRKVFLARADKEFLVEKGSLLEEGYLVEAITAEEVKLVYEPLQHRVSIPIPVTEGSTNSGGNGSTYPNPGR